MTVEHVQQMGWGGTRRARVSPITHPTPAAPTNPAEINISQANLTGGGRKWGFSAEASSPVVPN